MIRSRMATSCLQWVVIMLCVLIFMSFFGNGIGHELKLKPKKLKENFHQTDPQLINYVKKNLIISPSRRRYNLLYPSMMHEDQPGMAKKLEFLRRSLPVARGFFVEVGANDGQFISQTLALERRYGWRGLLIEPNKEPFTLLLETNRKARMLNVAVCPTTHTDVIQLDINPATRSGKEYHQGHKHESYLAPCIPLYTILAAINRKTVDYLSLDVGGMELDVLKTVPFDSVTVRVIGVVHSNPGKKLTLLRYYLAKSGYTFIGTIKDYIMEESLFVHESVYDENMKSLLNLKSQDL